MLQMLSCVTGNSDEPAGNRGSCKSQFDGNPGRSNMQKAAPWGDQAKVWPGRDYSLEEVAKHMQDFVQYLIDENSPLAERYGNKVPSDEEAIVIAKRMGGAMLPSQGWPNPTTIFMRQASQVDADRFPLNRFWARWADANCIWDACLQDPDWSLAMENESKEVGYNVKETLYALHGGVCQSGDIMNMGNIARAWDATTQLDFFVDINLWFCPNNGNADIIFPCQHWMELDSTRVSQGSGGMFGCCCAAIEPPGETIYDPDWNVGMYKAMGVPWNTKDPDAAPAENLNYAPQCQTFIDKWSEQLGADYDASGAPSYLWPDHDRVLKDNVDKWCTAEFPEGPTWAEAKQRFTDHGWMDCREWHPERWGTFRRHEMGWRRSGRLQPVPARGLPPRLHDHPVWWRSGRCVRGLHLQHGRGAGGLRQVGALRPAAVPGRRRPLPDLPRAYRLAGGEARAVRPGADRPGRRHLLHEPWL
ncbi:MAG: hypothetical protein ACLUVF_10355 [Adlercreutzia sp.]